MEAGVDEWLMRTIQAIYRYATRKANVGNEYNSEFSEPVGLQQGSVFNLLLFIIVLQVITEEFKSGCFWEFLYDDDDLIFTADTLSELEKKFQVRQQGLEL